MMFFVKLPKVVIGCIKDQIVCMCTTSFGLQCMCQDLKYTCLKIFYLGMG